MTERVDVLVVGGGPAGLATAQTAAAGGSVLVVHRDKEVGRPVRTSGGTWRRDTERLGIPEDLYHPIRGLRMVGPTREAAVRFGADHPVVLDVTRTYRYLADLARKAGAAIECGAVFRKVLERSAEGALCLITTAEGEREVAARFVVDASGHARAVLESLGLARRPARFGLGAEYEMEDLSADRETALLFVGEEPAPAGYGWVCPALGGTVRVGIGVIRPDTSAAPARLLERYLHSGMAEGMGLRVGALRERHTGVIPADGLAPAFVHGRIVAVGDSAGQALPLIGEGISYSIEAGRRLGEALGRALADPAGAEAHLERYQCWWNAVYRRRFDLAQRANLRISGYRDAQWDEKLRLLALFSGDDMAAFLRVQFGTGRLLRLVARHPLPVARHLLARRLRRR